MKNRNIQFNILLIFVLSIIAVAVFAPYIATHDPNKAVLTESVKAPSNENWFGTDRMGRDLFSRVIYGSRTSISSTLILVSSVLVLGGVLGTIAGYFGGAVDVVIMRFADMMVSFPGMALAIAIAGIMGPSITNAVIAITMVSWTKYARLARSLVFKTKNLDYIRAALISGTKAHHILLRYMMPSVLPTLIITSATDVGGMMLELAGFSFLGLGAQSTSIEWGYMLNEGRSYMASSPWLMIYPGLAIFITVAAFNLFGDSLRDKLDPQNDYQVLWKNSKMKRRVFKYEKEF